MHANAAQFVGQKSSEAVGAKIKTDDNRQSQKDAQKLTRKDLRIKLNEIVTFCIFGCGQKRALSAAPGIYHVGYFSGRLHGKAGPSP